MMNGKGDRRPWNTEQSNNSNSTKLSVAELLAAERALSHEERVRRAMNLKPYLDYLSDLFTEKLSDGSCSEDETQSQTQTATALGVEEEDSKSPGIIQAIHTLNVNLGETLPSVSNFQHGKSVQTAAAAFSPTNSFSRLGLSPDPSDNRADTDELPPLSDLELHKYLEKSTPPGLNSPADDYLISFLGSAGSDFVSKRERKWDSENSSSLCELKPKSPSLGCSGGISELQISKSFATTSRGMNPEEDEIQDCLKTSITHDKLNLNQTAREDNDEECVDGNGRKQVESMVDDNDDNLSDYMNIMANSALALDTYLKFDTEELTAATGSPISPSAAQIMPNVSIHRALNLRIDDSPLHESASTSDVFGGKGSSVHKQTRIVQILNMKRRRIYIHMCKKEIIKIARIRSLLHEEVRCHTRQLANMCSRHLYHEAIVSHRIMKDSSWRAKRLAQEMLRGWKQTGRNEKEKKQRKAREAEEQKQLNLQINEVRLQQQKLNILAIEMRIFASQIFHKLKGAEAFQLKQKMTEELEESKGSMSCFGDAEWAVMKHGIAKAVNTAIEFKTNHGENYFLPLSLSAVTSGGINDSDGAMGRSSEMETAFSSCFTGTLRVFQQSGLEWLIKFFDHGINGLLADESGLGKTIQALSLLGHLSERRKILGPFLIITHASELINWANDVTKCLPAFTTAIYTGNSQDRKILRESWQLNPNLNRVEKSPFHILLSSYEVAVADLKHLDRIKWIYFILDEAQGVAGLKWKHLLMLNCRNRLLLAGKIIPNKVKELWRRLHFVMPSLFDTDEKFQEFASANIESHQSKWVTNEMDLTFLKEILKKFTLRRLKKDVESELSEKVEILVKCPITLRQRYFISDIKATIRLEYMRKSFYPPSLTQREITSLMTAVMQLRKVCNHPDLLRKRDLQTPFYMKKMERFYPRKIFFDVFPSERLRHWFQNHFNIFNPSYTHHSLFRKHKISSVAEDLSMDRPDRLSEWSFIRFVGIGSSELFNIATGGFQARLTHILTMRETFERIYRDRIWHSDTENTSSLKAHDFLLYPNIVTSFPSVQNSHVLKDFVFVSTEAAIYAFLDQNVYSTGEGGPKTEIRCSAPAVIPSCLKQFPGKVMAGGIYILFWRPEIDTAHTATADLTNTQNSAVPSVAGFDAGSMHSGWPGVTFPNEKHLVLDSGKLRVLESILSSLKLANNNAVVVYTQMVRMLDVLEEYFTFRKWNYIRVHDSAKDFDIIESLKSNSEFFIVLAWTRADCLGLSLSFADTVVFYDNDWNPVVDRRALDRVYRMDRTKKLTVYRLVCDGTIEYKILEQTNEKYVQEGTSENGDAIKPFEMLSLLEEDEELNLRSSGSRAHPCDGTDCKPFVIKRKTDVGLQSKLLKEKFAKKFRVTEHEATSSVTSSVSVTGSSPANSDDRYMEDDGDTEFVDEEMQFESDEEEDELETNVLENIHDVDCVDGSVPRSSRLSSSIIEWNTGSISDYDDDLILSKPKVSRGGRRGRPPVRVRVMPREDDASRRGRPVGRPRLKRVGPMNQGVRGRKPGRPPLMKKADTALPHQPSHSGSILLPVSTMDSS